MKKIIAIIVLGAAFAFSAAAQPKAVGGRFGATGLEASYEHYLGSPNFMELNAGFYWLGGFGGTATFTYNFTVLQPNWTSRGEWALYTGPGIFGGYAGAGYREVDEYGNIHRAHYGYGMLALAPQVGLEYTFWFPLQLSVDIRPLIGVAFDRGSAAYYLPGLYGFIPSLSVRYAF